MKSNEKVRKIILEVADNQIRHGEPPETKQTFERLRAMGYSDTDAKMYIGQCIAVEIFDILKHNQSFDEKRYFRNLLKLPKQPWK
jgi:hypothetical protein